MCCFSEAPPTGSCYSLLDLLLFCNFWMKLPSKMLKCLAVSIWWTGLGTGLWDWTVGLDCGTGLTESCAHLISKQHTHYFTTVYLHHMNWTQGRRPSLDINIDRTRQSFSSHLYQCVCYTKMCTCTGHYPTAVL